MRLLPAFLEAGHTVKGLVRDKGRFPSSQFADFLADGRLELLEGDMLEPEGLPEISGNPDAAYYLLHSMGAGKGFEQREEACARNFTVWIAGKCKRVIYLGGLVPEGGLSDHLESRENVNRILRGGEAPVTTLRASIIVGSGSASFEIIRDLVEKLPVMLTPKWTRTRCQPVAIRNVIGYLTCCLGCPETEGDEFDIGGPEVLTYRELLRQYADVRGLVRLLVPVPFLTPGLSSHWLRLVTSTTLPLAKSLVGSLTNETVCRDRRMPMLIPQELLTYRDAIETAFSRIAQNRVPSSWINSLSSGRLDPEFFRSIKVPEHGVLRDRQKVPLIAERGKVIDAVWSIGGRNGWPSMNWAWKARGALDRLAGGIGMRRGRRHPGELFAGDALDFWRVVIADRGDGEKPARLILSAEMKLPGEAWLDFEITGTELVQTATFRPRGLFGRLYWYSVLPFHLLLFPVMAKRLASGDCGKADFFHQPGVGNTCGGGVREDSFPMPMPYPTIIPGLRSPYDHVGGIVYFGRMLDKIRLNAEGKLPKEWATMVGPGHAGSFDSRCCHFLGIDYEAVVAETLKGGSDDELLAWAFAKGRKPDAEDIEVWNGFMTKRGWRDAGSQRVKERLKEIGLEPDTVRTMFDFIDLDEGRR